MQRTVGMGYANAGELSAAPYLREPILRLAGSGGRALDVGCGNGYWSGLLAERGFDVVGIDPSPSGISIARRTYPRCRFEELAAASDLLDRLGEAPFDLVVSTEVVEHLYDPYEFARGCFRALKPSGRLILSTPYHGWLKNVTLAAAGRFDRHHEALRVGGHIKFFSRATLHQLLADAGFQDIGFEGAGRTRWLWKSMLATANASR